MKATFVIVLILFSNLMNAQTVEDIIVQIRQQFKTINTEIKSYTTKSDSKIIEESVANQNITAYFKDNQLMKIEEEFLGDMAESMNQYYYWENQLFFVFTTNTYHTYYEGIEETTTNENRYYFNENKLIRWLDSGKNEKDKNSEDFKNNEKTWLKAAEKLMQEFENKD